MKNSNLKGNLILLLAAFIWGLSFIAQSKGVEVIPPIAFNGIRSMLGAVVLLPVIFMLDSGKKKRGEKVTGFFDKTQLTGGIFCGMFLCLASTLQTWGLLHTSPGKSAFITALYMVMVPIVSLFMGKKLRISIVISVVVAVVGMYLMCIDEELAINKGDIITLFSAIAFTGHILCIDSFSPRVDGVKLSCTQFFVCGLINLLLMPFTGTPGMGDVLNSWLAIGYAGAMSCGVAYTLQIVGQKYTDPSSASIIMSLESVFATLATVILVACGWSLTGGALSLRELSGCLIMFVAILLVQLPEKRTELIKNA